MIQLTDEDREKLWAKLESIGFEGVQLARNNGVALGDDRMVVLWLQSKAFDRQQEQQDLSRRAVEAAERAATAAESAALASQSSARWTMLAAVMAFLTIAMALLNDFLRR